MRTTSATRAKLAAIAALIGLSSACGVGSTPGGVSAPGAFALIAPPVAAATPAALLPPKRKAPRALDRDNFKNRFFSGAGPTDIFSILESVDARLTGINDSLQQHAVACASQAEVAYTLAPWGQTVDMYAQCYQKLGGAGFLQLGKHAGATYLYLAGPVGAVAAIATPVASGADAGSAGDYEVQAWVSVGTSNATSCASSGTFDGCSYGVIQLRASSIAKTFEVSVAGIGLGFCGAQLTSDGASVFARGSEDGPDGACNPVDTLCASAADLTMPGSCDALTSFALPALGRAAVTGLWSWAASAYPAAPDVTLDGTPTDALAFGPSAPTPGVGAFAP